MSKELRKILDLEPDNQDNSKIDIDQIDDDFDFARKSIYDIIGKGQMAIEDLIDVARSSQHPRAYEVLNNMLKNIVEMNKDLLVIQKQKKEISGEQTPSTVNNNLFVGTTSDLNKFIENNKNKSNE